MNAKLALSFSYNGLHKKANWPHGSIEIDPIKHLQMLIAAIDCANPKGEHDVIVSAICFDIWKMSKQERVLALEVYKRARMVLSRNSVENHQNGAACCIRMAMEYAAIIKSQFLIHLAEDVVMAEDYAEYFTKHLVDCDYVGSWFLTNQMSFNTQVFGCRVSAFVDFKLNRFIIPFEVSHMIECDLYDNICRNNLRYKVGDNLAFPEGRRISFSPSIEKSQNFIYEHTHDPDVFRKIIESRGVKWTKSKNDILI